MAWYAELKRRKWYCIKGVDMICFYKKYLYDEWYNSLTDEQKQRLEERRQAKKRKEEREARAAMQQLAFLTGYIRSRTPNGYPFLYEEFGFPRL